jgi:hypothetical protein
MELEINVIDAFTDVEGSHVVVALLIFYKPRL